MKVEGSLPQMIFMQSTAHLWRDAKGPRADDESCMMVLKYLHDIGCSTVAGGIHSGPGTALPDRQCTGQAGMQ